MADPLGTTASVLGALQAAATAIQYLKDVKAGASERVRLRDEMRCTVLVLEMIRDRLEDSGGTLATKSATMDAFAAPQGPVLLFKQLAEDIVVKLAPQDRLRRLAQPFRWPFDKQSVNEMLAALERMKTNFSLVTQNELVENLRLTSLTLNEVSGQVTSLADSKAVEEREQVLTWISSLSFSSKHAEALAGAQLGTGQWFLNDEKLQTWLDAEDGGPLTLWCPGIPGAGKTTIASLVIDHLGTRPSCHKEEALAYVYCDYKSRETQSSVLLMCSIVGQILRRMSSLPSDVSALYELHKKHETRPSLAQVVGLLKQIIVGFDRLFIVVDALDECSESEEVTLNLLSSILDLGDKVRLLCTSRFSSTFDNFFREAARLEISARAEDVRLYIETQIPLRSRLSKHVRADPKLKDEIIDAITGESQGMFLLATLHFESLSQKLSRKEVRNALRTLPKTLDATYEQALVKLHEKSGEDGELAETILFWVVCARRPLRVLELQHMYAVQSLEPGDRLEEDDLPDAEILTGVCGGLISIDQDFNFVRIVHYTAQQYFMSVHQEKIQETRIDVTRLSLAYLILPNLQGGASTSDADLVGRLTEYPFLEYAARHWGSEGTEVSFEELWSHVDDFVASEDAISTANQVWSVPDLRYRHWSQDIAHNVPALVVVSCFELPQVIQKLVANGHNIEGKGTDEETPLIRSASLGHTGNISVLLDLGADVDAEDNNAETALGRAASKGHTAVVEKLLQGGANVNAKAAASWTILMSAVAGGSLEAVRLVVDAGADLAAQTEWGDSALSLAMRNGQETLATFLADRGATMPDSSSGRRASVVAARKGLRALVRRLTGEYDLVAREGLQRRNTARVSELAHIAELPEEENETRPASPSTGAPSDQYTHLSDVLDGINYSRGFWWRYSRLEEIGRGRYTQVFLCKSQVSSVNYAVKIYAIRDRRHNPRRSLEGIREELRSLKALHHPNVLSLIDIVVHDSMSHLYMVLELAAAGELFHYIVSKQKLSEEETRPVIAQLLSALLYIHEQGWVHRDIKPENILLMDMTPTIKLGDFGSAKHVESGGCESVLGSLPGTTDYTAPEVFAPPEGRKYSYPVDIWSVGVVLYACLSGFPPFADELFSRDYPFTLVDQILQCRFDYPSPYFDDITDPALDLIDWTIVGPPARRLTAAQCLEHPWLLSS